MAKIKNLKVGADPEVFLASGDKFVSAIGLVNGTKENPKYFGDNIFLQEDNVALEFSFKPATNKFELIHFIGMGLIKIEEVAKEHGLDVAVVPSAIFEEDQLLHPNAMMFGCTPDFDAWKKQMNNAPNPMINPGLRSAGGHIHIGYDEPTEETNLLIIKAMDLFIGVPSLEIDTDQRRRQLYGKAGCFRHKKYGVEYRTLSNFWIKDQETVSWIYDQILKAIEFINDDQAYLLDNYEEKILKAINNNDLEAQEELIKTFNLAKFCAV